LTEKVISIEEAPKAKASMAVSEKKWGKLAMRLKFSVIPSLLFRAQRRLGLNPTQLAVLLQLADYWWMPERNPYPTKKALSDRMGLSPRQIQRHIADLETAGLVKRIQRFDKGQKKSNSYDLSGLVKRLNQLAPEFIEADAKSQAIKKLVEEPGGLASTKAKKFSKS
jgi:DNA-binding transcriptional ArsR family regulator